MAKDFADRPERAIGYLRELSQLDPRAGTLASSIARMLQERGLWRPLIELSRRRHLRFRRRLERAESIGEPRGVVSAGV